jgi:AcrR family transcriptional regulator
VTPTTTARPQRKRPNAYHHGHLRQALVDQAVQTIGKQGVEALTLRGVGASLRVSRTALYRHFSDKGALLAAVATEGFRTFCAALRSAWDDAGRGRPGFEAMGFAYIRFAVTNPAHYRVMFGGFLDKAAADPQLMTEASAAFRVLLDSVVEQQQLGLIRRDDPERLSRYIWAVVHGVAMLAIDGQLPPDQSVDDLAALAIEGLRTGIRT